MSTHHSLAGLPHLIPARSPLLQSLLLGVGLAGGLLQAAPALDDTLQLHPENPHYFLWKGQPTVLITSGEHYGAVLNLDFNYTRYLDTLATDQLNLTRTFSGGGYFEPQGAFNIASNTLAPKPDRYLAPWARSSLPGYAAGGNKFDLTQWNPAYFGRLRDFVAQAGQRGVVVELNLFCPFYEEAQWNLSPFRAANNINGVGDVARTNVYTLDQHGGLLTFQEALVHKLVAELRDAGNVYYEICNEPYFGGVTLAWQHHIADLIAEAQREHPRKKLISQNVANGSATIGNPHPAVSIFNFHYAVPPTAVELNYSLNKVIGDNETGFRGTNDAPYRSEGWAFILAGGGLYNHLDYSFTVGSENGTFAYPSTQPGGGNPTFRRQLRFLREFIHSLDFLHMKPDQRWIKSTNPTGLETHALAKEGAVYAAYLRSAKPLSTRIVLEVELPAGTYRLDWLEPESGAQAGSEVLTHPGGPKQLQAPSPSSELALRIQRPVK